jgi:hypothetical protein
MSCSKLLGLPHQLSRRPYQDYSSWQTYLCQCQWDEIHANPSLAGEIITTQMSALGLKNPAEQTSADIASGIAAATHGQRVAFMSSYDMNFIFQAFKAQSQIFRVHMHACEARGYNRRQNRIS